VCVDKARRRADNAAMRSVWLNGEFMPENEATVSVFDRGLNFGQGVYEVTPVIGGKFRNWPHHAARLARSQAMCRIADETDWPPVLAELIARNGLEEGRIYLQVTGGTALDREFKNAQPPVPPTRFAFTQAASLIADPLAERGLRILLKPDLRWQLRSAKTTQLLYAVLMKEEARDAGCDDAWLVEDGHITEGTSANAYIVDARGVLVSHPTETGVLPGVTRIGVMDIARTMGIVVEERRFSTEELAAAREAFISGAGTLVLPVVAVDGAPVGSGTPGPVTAAIRAAYVERLRGE
jgi:D-alanine transaminase